MIRRRPRAIQALIETAEYIGQDNPAAADRFLRAAEVAFVQLHIHGCGIRMVGR